MNLFFGWIIFIVHLSCLKVVYGSKNPHIVIIYADDLGMRDVSYTGSPQIPTPNIDALAMNGIRLQNYYAEWLCTPSRASLLTGKYPMRLGLQHSVILGSQASGLPLNETIMPQYLKEFGYETHMIGKWHLGYQTKDYTPIYRGFDSFYGYWNGMIDYFDHTYLEDGCSTLNQNLYGLDLHDGITPVLGEQGAYATHLFTDKAEEIIIKHDTSKPLFLYFAHLAAHAGNKYQESQCPGDVVSQFMYIEDVNRRIHAGVISEMDKSVGAVVNALFEKDMLEDTIILFLADNGAEVDPTLGFGNNYPLRGNKWTFWEGAIHVPGLLWSPLLNLQKPRVANQLMHVSDWLPTLISMLGGDVDGLGEIDGIDMWGSLINDTPSPRTHMLQNLDPVSGTSAYRQGDLKFVNGTSPNDYIYWYGTSGLEHFNGSSTYEWVFKDGSIVKDILEEMDLWIVEDPEESYQKLSTKCQQPPPNDAFQCNSTAKPCLFNITADPCEYNDIADQYPDTVKEMYEIILKYKSEEMEPQNTRACDPSGNPMCHHFQYVTWREPDHYKECNFLSQGNSDKTN